MNRSVWSREGRVWTAVAIVGLAAALAMDWLFITLFS